MNGATVRPGPDGRLVLRGELNYGTVAQVQREAEPLLEQADPIQIDLQGVVRSDSAGLALLVEWMRAAKRRGKAIQFLNIPQQMLDIARVSSLDQVLPLSRG